MNPYEFLLLLGGVSLAVYGLVCWDFRRAEKRQAKKHRKRGMRVTVG
jgi:hypothetical protein